MNPIEVDENNVITDGERRWRAHKLAGLKEIEARMVKVKDQAEKLRRQLVVDIQDEEIPTEERYAAIVKLYKMKSKVGPTLRTDFAKELGITETLIKNAFQYMDFAQEEPETVEKVAPHIIIETASLPKEERKEVLKEFEGTKDKKKDLIRELVKEKKEKVQVKKALEENKGLLN
jgi:ParB-like chromosome segregation protein Spo0J